jgi:hypothetical protein
MIRKRRWEEEEEEKEKEEGEEELSIYPMPKFESFMS